MLSLIFLDLTLQEILSDIPHDAGAVIVYIMLALFAGFVVYGSRGKGSDPAPPPPEDAGAGEPKASAKAP